ncbi:MAG: AI-2E family transporter [Nitrospiria bacterium]
MEETTLNSDPRWNNPLGWVLFAILGIGCLYFSKSILAPFLVSFLLAYTFDPVIDFLENRKCPRSPAIWLVFTTILITFVFILFFGFPLLQDQTTKAFDTLPIYLQDLREEILPSLLLKSDSVFRCRNLWMKRFKRSYLT